MDCTASVTGHESRELLFDRGVDQRDFGKGRRRNQVARHDRFAVMTGDHRPRRQSGQAVDRRKVPFFRVPTPVGSASEAAVVSREKSGLALGAEPVPQIQRVDGRGGDHGHEDVVPTSPEDAVLRSALVGHQVFALTELPPEACVQGDL